MNKLSDRDILIFILRNKNIVDKLIEIAEKENVNAVKLFSLCMNDNSISEYLLDIYNIDVKEYLAKKILNVENSIDSNYNLSTTITNNINKILST